MDFFLEMMHMMRYEHPVLFYTMAFIALFILIILILFVRYYWKKFTGQWTTTMNYLSHDEVWKGKRIIYAKLTREEIDRAIDDFIEQYSSDEASVERPVVSQTVDGYMLTLPSTVGYEMFCYWVNYLVYSNKKKKYCKQVTALYEVSADAAGAWKQFAGEHLKFFIPETDDDCDCVYFTTKDNRSFKQEFAGSAPLKEQKFAGYTPLKEKDTAKKSLFPLPVIILIIAIVAIRVFFIGKQCYNIIQDMLNRSEREIEVANAEQVISEADTSSSEYVMNDLDSNPKNDPYVPVDTAKLSWAMRLISCGNSKALASMMSFPIPRKYPLPYIKDAKELEERFSEIFDEQFQKKMGEGVRSKWINYGYRGYCYGKRGDLWVYDKLYLIDYYSPQEQRRYEQLVNKEMSTLHHSLKGNGWRPYCCFKSESGDIIRVDFVKRKTFKKANLNVDSIASLSPQLQPIKLRGDEIFRMAIYPKGGNLHGLPRTIMYGNVKISGSTCMREHMFYDEDNNIITLSDPFYDDVSLLIGAQSNLNSNSEQRHTEELKLTPCYWLDLIE